MDYKIEDITDKAEKSDDLKSVSIKTYWISPKAFQNFADEDHSINRFLNIFFVHSPQNRQKLKDFLRLYDFGPHSHVIGAEFYLDIKASELTLRIFKLNETELAQIAEKTKLGTFEKVLAGATLAVIIGYVVVSLYSGKSILSVLSTFDVKGQREKNRRKLVTSIAEGVVSGIKSGQENSREIKLKQFLNRGNN